MAATLNSLLLGSLLDSFRQAAAALPDSRSGPNTCHSVVDAALSALAPFFCQDPSFPAFQPVDRKAGSKLVADVDCVLEAAGRIVADLRGLGGRAGREDRVEKGLASDHRAADPVLVKGLVDAGHGLPLTIREEVIGVDDVAVVGCPARNPDFSKVPDHILKPDRLPGGRMKERLAL